MLISRYKIEVKDEPEFSGETFEERKERILRAKAAPILTYVSKFSTYMITILTVTLPQSCEGPIGIQKTLNSLQGDNNNLEAEGIQH